MPAAPPVDVARLLRQFSAESLEHAILVIDRAGRIARADPGAERIFG